MIRRFTPLRCLFATTTVAAAVVAAAFVAPVAAGSTWRANPAVAPTLSYCEPAMPASWQLFSPLVPLSPAVGRGGIVREPDLGQLAEDLPASARGKAPGRFRVTVPVYFHVISDGSTGNVSNSAINDQIDVMNLAFRGFYGGANTGFSFSLAGVTRTNNAAWFYAGPTTNEERAMKHALHQGGANALNIYSSTAGVYLGWAYLPDIVQKPGQAYLDGIVIDWESMVHTSPTYEGRYDLGLTAVHETGHWLNLEHTFFGGCNRHGDYVDDTPAELTPTSGCPADGTKDTCLRDPGFDPIHNYMDYSYDQCYREFTPGQVQRERDSWLLYRAG